MPRNVLILSYLFPPRGGAGVQRALKFAKYLPQFGWRPLIVTSANPARDFVTQATDPTLLNDLPPDAIVHRTDLTEFDRVRYSILQQRWAQRLVSTDPIGWWVGPAIRAGMDLLHRVGANAIVVTMSPFTAAEAGMALKRYTKLPLILDLRDPWALDETRIYPSAWHAWRDWGAMQRALWEADLVIMNTPQAVRAVREEFLLRPRTRIIALTNGYDEGDLGAQDRTVQRGDELRIVHTGMFHSEWAPLWDDLLARRGLSNRLKHARRPINLWTRTPRYLLKAMELAAERGVRSRLLLVGELTAADRAMVEASPVRDRVQMLGYQTHAASVEFIQSAQLLFLPLHTPLDGGAALIVPGKTYEYLGTGRPVLAMGPPGDMRDFVLASPNSFALAGDDVAGAADVLCKVHSRKELHYEIDTTRFTRRELTRQLAMELDRVCGHHPEPSTDDQPGESNYKPINKLESTADRNANRAPAQ